MDKKKKVLCIDFDDCLINWNLLSELKNNQIIMELENTTPEEQFLKAIDVNFNIIKNIAEKYNMEIFITSSWSLIIDKNLEIKKELREKEILNELEKKILSIIKKNIGKHVIGVDFKRKKNAVMNNRIKTIKELSKKYEKVIVIDDLNLNPEFKNINNVYFIRIINEIIYQNNKIWGNIFKLDEYLKKYIFNQ